MSQPSGDAYGNVVPLHRNWQLLPDETPIPVSEIAEAVRSFGLLEQCVDSLHSTRLGVAGEIDRSEQPIVSLQAQLPVIQRWLGRLECLNVSNWSDTRWVLKLGEARAVAAFRLRAVKRSLYRSPPGIEPLDRRLAADICEFEDALRALRHLIVDRYPQTQGVPGKGYRI